MKLAIQQLQQAGGSGREGTAHRCWLAGPLAAEGGDHATLLGVGQVIEREVVREGLLQGQRLSSVEDEITAQEQTNALIQDEIDEEYNLEQMIRKMKKTQLDQCGRIDFMSE